MVGGNLPSCSAMNFIQSRDFHKSSVPNLANLEVLNLAAAIDPSTVIMDEFVDAKVMEDTLDQNLVTFRDTLIKDVLAEKVSHDLHFIRDNATVFNAITQMKKSKIGALLVKDATGEVVGIITERDYLNKVALSGLKSPDTLVKSIMTSSPLTVSLHATVMRCLALMTHYRFRHLIVTDKDKKVVGVVSIGDLVKAVLEQYKETIYFLREYIEKRW